MKSEAQEIAEVVSLWLHYKALTGLSGLLNEASMAVPIAEYLASRYGSEVQSERMHPLFHSAGRGRPKQLDFVRVKRGESTWHAAYESKFHSEGKSGIVDDLCRLACLSQVKNIGTPHRFLIFAGRRDRSEKLFSVNLNTGNGSREDFFGALLSQDDAKMEEKHRFSLASILPGQRSYFYDFAKKYDARLPSIFVTELSGWYATGRFTCGVWKVLSARGSKLLSRDELGEL